MPNPVENNLEIFKLAVERACDEFYLFRTDGSLVYLNEKASAGLGYGPAELETITLTDLDPRYGPELPNLFARLKSTELPAFETVHLTRSGQAVPKELKPVYLRAGGEEYICLVGRDLDRRKRMEDKLRKSEEKYRRLVENLREEYFFYSHDIHGIFTYLSPSITNILGYSPREFYSHYTEYLTGNPVNEEVVKRTELSIRGIRQPSYELEIYHKNGSIRWLEVTEVPIFDQGGRVVAVEGIAHDITGRKKIYEEMDRKARELEEVNAAMKVLLRQCAEARGELEEKMVANIKDLVLPHLGELEVQLSDPRKKMYINVIRASLEGVTSSFSNNLAVQTSNRLTPREIQVADLVRSGRTNKEIAQLLHISKRTVECYRDNLRRKLSIRNKKINLRSYLLSTT